MSARRAPPVSYELVDHTADVGIEVTGTSVSDLFASAAMALADLIYEPERVSESAGREIHLEAAGLEELLVRWLNELIVLRELEDFVWGSVEVEVTEDSRLSAVCRGETCRPEKHRVRTALKAATYHQLRVDREGPGFRARIIFDA